MIPVPYCMSLILTLCLFALSFLIFMGLFPLKYLKGRFYKCMSVDIDILSEYDCYDYGGDWINNDFPWDNILQSVFNLFIIATCEGWSAFMVELGSVGEH